MADAMKASLVFLLALPVLPLHAQGPGKPPHPARAARLFDLSELAAQRDKFEGFRSATLLGGENYGKDGVRLAKRHAEIFHGLEKGFTTGRLSSAQAKGFLDDLLAIGAKAKAARGEGGSVAADVEKELGTALDALAGRAKAAATEPARAELSTPQLAESEWTIGEVLRFGQAGAMSKAQTAAIERRLDALAKKESKAKEDGKLSDAEREDLLKEARETWKEIVDALD